MDDAIWTDDAVLSVRRGVGTDVMRATGLATAVTRRTDGYSIYSALRTRGGRDA